ncbi:MAG: 3-oxoacyl-[acyl-carrier-protein] synthase 2 [Anaerolineales bacterium]|nr:3-oxoacyl-[acyl-carrier-protein] synthase 2 [Anaerolineales bacterium]
MERVFVTGLGSVTPIGLTVGDFWRNLTAGVSGVGPITHFDSEGFPVQIAAEVTDFDPLDYMGVKEARRSHRSAHFALAASRQALEDAGLKIDRTNAEDVGVVMNTGIGGGEELADAGQTYAERGPRRISPLLVPSIMPNAVACQVSIHMGARGPVITSTSACASGTQALLQACYLLRRGEAQVVIAGSTEAPITPVAMASFANARALSRRNDEPERASRPFDRDRDGFIVGEGGVAMVLETESHARDRDAHVYAEVAGGALTADAYHITAPDPDGDGAVRAMSRSLSASEVHFEEVDVVFAHGTSTALNDVTETRAIKTVFGERAGDLAISATKSMVGHLLGAAGGVSTLAAVLSVYNDVVPPTINLEHPDPECDLDYVAQEAREQTVGAAMVNAFGFGGQNAVVMVRQPGLNGR